MVQEQRNNFPIDHASPTFMKERVIMSDVRNHLNSMEYSTKAYAKATRSNVKFLLAENDQMEKDLQEAR